MIRTKLLFLILGLLLLIPAYSGAVITDTSTDNLDWINTRWDYRDYGDFGTANWIGGSRLRSGAGMLFECIIELGGSLTNIEDVIRIVAVNTLSKKRYILHYEPFYWPPSNGELEYWSLIVHPDESMFEGDWKFILYYEDSNGNKHRQVKITSPPAKVFPAAIGNVTVSKFRNFFEVSWSGIGDPNSADISYRVLVLDANNGDVEEVIYGTYDSISNQVTVKIPVNYKGAKYGIRLASTLFGNKSLYYMILPKK